MTTLSDFSELAKRLSPEGICDDCIAIKLAFPDGHDVSRLARELSNTQGFHRERDLCGVCGQNKLVIWYATA